MPGISPPTGSARPVVSPPMPEVKLYSHLVEVADTSEGFVRAVEAALASGLDARTIRTAAMAVQTWSGKVDQICRHLSASVGFPQKGAAHETVA
jgi:hypothetical protein